VNEYTFEVDLFTCGRHKSICKTLIELTGSQSAKDRAENWRKNPDELDPEKMLSDIEKIGKGRFAQRLAGNMKSKDCPTYIEKAIKYVATRCR